MAYKAYVTTLKNVRPHPNADRMKLADCFGNTVCVGLDAVEGDVVIYFPVDGQLSEEYANQNNLVRKKDENGNNIGGYLDPEKRNIKAIKLRGEKSDGLTMPLSSLAYTDINLNDLNIGDTIDVVNGHEICKKYIPRRQHRQGGYSEGNKTRKHKVPVAPLFVEHADTEQLAYNLAAFKPGDEIEITLKMHGTSQRTGYLPVLKGYNDSWLCKAHNRLWFWFNYITKKNDLYTTLDKMKHDGKPYYEYDYISGTRRTVLENYEGGYYGSNEFREQHSKIFEGKLWKGETIYYEVVGFTHTGAPIMASCNNNRTNDKDFIKQYGEETVFSYGCEPEASTLWSSDGEGDYDLVGRIKQSDLYVYRMTMTNEDGEVIEYTPDFMRYRCEQMGVKTVPVFANFILHDYDLEMDTRTPGEIVKDVAEKYYDGPDPIGKTHVREGVVVRIINRPKFCAYKHKNWYFKALEGIIKDTAEAPDMEEAQDVSEENITENN